MSWRSASLILNNTGSQFYCCQKDISDPERCKFFCKSFVSWLSISVLYSSADWADQIEELSKMSSTPRKRSSTSGSQPETPSQKRLRLIQETLGQASNDEDGSSLLMTPPSTNHKPASARFFTREESPTPLPGPSASHNFLSTVDYSVSQELYSLTQSLQGLQPDIERLERLNSAANKTTNIKTDRIKQLEAENEMSVLKNISSDTYSACQTEADYCRVSLVHH